MKYFTKKFEFGSEDIKQDLCLRKIEHEDNAIVYAANYNQDLKYYINRDVYFYSYVLNNGQHIRIPNINPSTDSRAYCDHKGVSYTKKFKYRNNFYNDYVIEVEYNKLVSIGNVIYFI